MWRTDRLKTLVHGRLKAAAEEIFSLFEETIREYEEEVWRSKRELEQQQARGAWTAPVQPFLPAEDVPSAQDHCEEKQTDQCEDNQELPHIKEEDEEEEQCDYQTSENQGEADSKDNMFNIISVKCTDKFETPSSHQIETIEDREKRCLAGCSSQPVKEDCGALEQYNDCQLNEVTDDECRDSGQDSNIKKTQRGGEAADRPYTCNACDKTFKLKSILTRHMKTHTGDKPYSCVVCGKSFIQRSYLQTHMNSHSGQKPYKCSFCGRGFTQVGNMNAHIRIHTGEKPHTCVECGKSFREKADLIKHTIIHTGEKPYSCTVCNMKFSAQSNLTRHMKSHSGERPYSCTDCGKKFFRRSHLIIHTKTHTGVQELDKDAH